MLYGKTLQAKDRQYIFIDGAISVDIDLIFHRNIEVYAEAWEKLNVAAREYFTDLELVGWACEDDVKAAEEVNRRFFQEGSKIFIQLNDLETDYYLARQGHVQRLDGYYIYYTRNEAMQTYMVEQQADETPSVEDLRDEHTIEQFRQVMKERKEIVKHGRMMNVLSCASSFLALVVLAIGITMVNNYEKMQDMETTLVELSEAMNEEEETLDMESMEAVMNEEVINIEETVKNVQENEGEGLTEVPEEAVSETVNIEEKHTEAINERTYIVQKGDTLARISMQFYQTRDMVDSICELNQIGNRDIILCGQKILLP